MFSQTPGHWDRRWKKQHEFTGGRVHLGDVSVRLGTDEAANERASACLFCAAILFLPYVYVLIYMFEHIT